KHLKFFDVENNKFVTNASELKLDENQYSEFQRDYVTFAALNFGFRFGVSNYSQVLPTEIYKEFDDNFQLVLNDFVKSESMRNNLLEHFIISLVSSNAHALDYIPKETLTPKQNGTIDIEG